MAAMFYQCAIHLFYLNANLGGHWTELEQTLTHLTMDVQNMGFPLLKHGAQNCPLYGDFTTTLRLYRQYLPNQTHRQDKREKSFKLWRVPKSGNIRFAAADARFHSNFSRTLAHPIHRRRRGMHRTHVHPRSRTENFWAWFKGVSL